MGASAAKWKHCPLITKAQAIARNVGTVAKTHETKITSRYNTQYDTEVASCTREFFQNLYDHARKDDVTGMCTSMLMRRATGGHSDDGILLEEIAFTLNTSRAGAMTEVARVQITPGNRGQQTVLAFVQHWDEALDNSHLLLHSDKPDAHGNAGGFREGFKVAANSLLRRFHRPDPQPCQIVMVMNGRTWHFCYRDFPRDIKNGSTFSASRGIDQLVVDEYTTQVYGGMVVFVDIPMKATSLESIWNPNHYIPTMPLATWMPLLPPEATKAMSYVHFLEDPEVPSQFFQLGIYVGTVYGSKGAFFNEGGNINIGRDRADTSQVISSIRTMIGHRVKLLPVGSTDHSVMEHLMRNPSALPDNSWSCQRQLYESVLSYVRKRDRVPGATEIFLVDVNDADEVTKCLNGAEVDVHVVGVEKTLWTYDSKEKLSKALMIKTFTQLSNSEKFQVEEKVLAAISPQICWVLGRWPGTTFQTYMGQSKRYFEDTKSSRNLVPAELLERGDYFTGLCFDAWSLSGLDPLVFMLQVGPDPSILRNPNRMSILRAKAKQQASSGNRLLVGAGTSPESSPAGWAVEPPASVVFGGSEVPPNSFSGGSAIDPDHGRPISPGAAADEPLRFPPPTLRDPSGLRIGGQSGRLNNIIDSVDDDKETRLRQGPLRNDLGFELFVAENVSDQEASWHYDRFMSTPGVIDALCVIVFTAKSFHFAYGGVSYGPVQEPIVRLFAASPSCSTLGFNIVNDRALWINVSALLGENNDQRTVVAGLVRTAMHELAHACTPGRGHGCAWDVGQALANQTFYYESYAAGLREKIWHPTT